MSYSAISDYKDIMLKDFVTDDYIADSDLAVEDFAKSLGVMPEKIVTPYPHTLKKLAIAITYNAVAGDQSMMNAISSEAGAGKDAYELKRAYWFSEIERLKDLITAGMLTGIDDGIAINVSFPFSIPMQRA